MVVCSLTLVGQLLFVIDAGYNWFVYLSNWVYLLKFQTYLSHEIIQNMHLENNSYQTILDMDWLNCFHDTYFVWFHSLKLFEILKFAYIFSSSFSPLYQTCRKQYYGGLEYLIINTNTRICYQSVIILEPDSSTLYDSRAFDGCWHWLPIGGIINQWVVDDTLCCAMNCT